MNKTNNTYQQSENGNATGTAKAPNAVARALNKFFGMYDRGSNIKTEIYAGLLMFFELAAFILIGSVMLTNGTNLTSGHYFGVYFATAFTTAVTSILIGIWCNVPLVQSTSLGLISVMLSIYGANTGLTYANLMAIGFVGNLVYLVIMVIPATRNFIAKGIPASVRKALPAALGLFLIMFALLQLGVISISNYSLFDFLSGRLTATEGSMDSYGVNVITLNFDSADNWYSFMPIVSAMVGFLIMLVLKHFNRKHATIFAFLGALVFYVVMWLIRGNFRDYWFFGFAAPSYAEMQVYRGITAVLQDFDVVEFCAFNKYGTYTSGFDFSGYLTALETSGVAGGGFNVFLLFVTSAASITLLGACETGAALTGCAYLSGTVDENGTPMYTVQQNFRTLGNYVNVYSVNAFSGVVGCLLGCGPVSARAESAIGASEGGRTGFAAIIAGLLMIVTMFTTVFGGLFMNGAVVYGLLIFVGLMLLTSLKNCDFSSVDKAIPYLATILVAFLTMNFARAIVIGILADALIKLLSFKFKEFKPANIVVSVLSVIVLLFC